MDSLPARMRSHLRQHQLFWTLTGFIFISTILSFGVVYQEMHRKLSAHFEQIHEQKNYSQLQVFHRGYIFHFDRILKEYAGVADRLASDMQLKAAFQKGDRQEATRILGAGRKAHEYMTGLSLLDSTGVIFALSSAFPDGEKYLGTSLGSYEHVQRTLQEKKGVVVNVPKTISGRNALFFTQPAFDEKGEVVYVISVSVTLESLAQYLAPQSALTEFDALLADASGRVLFATDSEPVEEISIANDRVLEMLRTTERQKIEDQEMNYKNEKAFVIGEKILLGTGQFVLAASFYPVAQSAVERENLKYQINSLFLGFVVRTTLIFVVFVVLLIWMIQRHERLAHSQ